MGAEDGCTPFTRELRRVTWPRKFRASALGTYDGTVNSKDFLLTYILGMHAIGTDNKVRANWFPMVLKGSARSWLLNLPAGSIASWADLREQFVSAFQGGYKRSGTMAELHTVVQKPGETLRSFVNRFSSLSYSIPEAEAAAIIDTFAINVRDPKMREKLSTHRIRTTQELYALAHKCAMAEEGRLEPELAAKAAASPAEGSQKKGSRKRSGMQVLAAEPGATSRPAKKASSAGGFGGKPGDAPRCAIHANATHDAQDCRILQGIKKRREQRHEERRAAGACFNPGTSGISPATARMTPELE